jgi:hypothetical protein
MNFSQLLAEKSQTITEKWVAAVRLDRQIESADELSYTAIKNHVPDVLRAMSTVLSDSLDDAKTMVQASLQHGVLRAEQGFDPSEIAREYRLLRNVIFDTLEADLLQGTPKEIVRSMRLIDAVIDEAIRACFNSYFEERLKELQQLHSSLLLNNQELSRLVRTNQDNLSHLAHELKSPLTSIIGYSDLFLRQQRQQPHLKNTYGELEHIERVLRNGRHLLRLINNVLELSQYEAGKIKLQSTLVNVPELINNISEMLEPLAYEKNLQMIINCHAPQEVLIDSITLQQIVTNLASNAIRYTEKGTIKITSQVISEQRWQLSVADTGIGIAPEDQNRIFESYFRVECSDKSRFPDSTGLGLTIVSRLVKFLQGEIEVKSELGFGSTFTVTLPLVLSDS